MQKGWLRKQKGWLLAAMVAGSVVPIRGEAPSPAAPLLTAEPPIAAPGDRGGFDWMTVDSPLRRVLASHPGGKSLAVLDLRSRTARTLPIGEVSGVALDPAGERIFAAGANNRVIILNRRSLAVIGEVALPGPGDCIAFNPANHLLYVDHDDGVDVWVIDPAARQIIKTIQVGGAPEYLAVGPHLMYQNVKTTNCIKVIDPQTNQVIATWPTRPVTSPHGLAVDMRRHRLYSAGNGVVAVVDLPGGKVSQTVAIQPGYVDQIALDSDAGRLYCASGAGVISVVDVNSRPCRLLGNVPGERGAHTLAIDPVTHSVWISFSTADGSYLQEYRPAQH